MPKRRNELEAKLMNMNYWELVKEEDRVLLAYENLSKKRASKEKVKWDGGRIFMAILSLFIWLILFVLFSKIIGPLLPPIIANTPIFIGIPLVLGFIALGMVDRLWHKTFTPFGRTLVRGMIHYWPATLTALSLLFI